MPENRPADADTTPPPTQAELGALGHAIRRALELSEAHPDRAPIVAAVLVEDAVAAWGDNEVHVDGDPSRHAEIVAIANACANAGTRRLDGASLITTLQPCEMCLGAMGMAGIDRVVFAAGRAAVAEGYFSYPGLGLEDFAAAARSPLAWCGPIMEADVLRLYAPGGAPGTQD